MKPRSIFLLGLAVTSVFFVNWCDVVFQCGCRSLWNGIATHCNIHDATGPHCPWCEHPLAGGAVAFGAVVIAQWASVYRTKASTLGRLALALAAFPIVSGLVALVQRFVWSYWPG